MNINPGEVEIVKLDLVTTTGNRLNLIGYATQIEIFESIISSSIMGEMGIADATGLLDNVSLTGSKIELEIKTNNVKSSVFEMTVGVVRDSNPETNGRAKTYVLEIASKEFIEGIAIHVSEYYNNLGHSDMITSIVNQYIKTKKKLYIEPTLGLDSIAITDLNPFQAIDKIRRRTVSRNLENTSYCFFENQNGMNFTTIENIMKDELNNPAVTNGDRVFFYDGIGKGDAAGSDWRNIILLSQPKTMDLIKMSAGGGVQNNIQAFNFETGKYTVLDSNSDESVVLDGDGQKDLMVSKSIKGDFLVTNNDDDINIARNRNNLRLFLLDLLASMINIQVNGDNLLTVGTCIKLRVPVMSGMSKNELNENLSGMYMISRIRHSIIPTGKAKYTQSLELLRNKFEK